MSRPQMHIFRCPVCETLVEGIDELGVELICCGPPMVRLEEKSDWLGWERHQPVVQHTPRGVKVRVGEYPHPMGAAHHISWIEVASGGKVYREFLEPHQPPVAEFPLFDTQVVVRAYCTVHGLWVHRSSRTTEDSTTLHPACSGA